MPTTIPITESKYSLAEKIDATPEVMIVRFKPDNPSQSTFEPGMFMMISGVDATGKKYIGRAFSIASDPSAPNMEFFIIKQHLHTDNTIVKSHFMDSNIGDIFMLKGPNGQFRFDPNLDKKVVFIAGGTGLAPFMSMLRHIKLIKSATDIITLYSVKYPTEIILKSELEQLTKDLKMKMIITVTRPQGAATPAPQQAGASAPQPPAKPGAPSTTVTTITTTTIVTTTGTSPPQSTTKTTTTPAASLQQNAPKIEVPQQKQSDVPIENTKPPLQPAMVQPLVDKPAPEPQQPAPTPKPAQPVSTQAPTSQASDAYTAETGHIDAKMISKYCNDTQERTFYICGPLPFVQAVKTALTSLNIPNEKVKADVWG